MEKILVKNLNFKYDNSGFCLKNINLRIKEGEFVLLTGPSASGKSTLAYCLSGIIPHCIKNGKMKGNVWVNGKNTKEEKLSELARKVGMVFQNPESQIFGMTVEEDIAFGLENLNFPREEIRKRINKILKFLELKKFKDKPPECLSGGQKQRLVIGSVLVMEPEVLILDEPVSNLDPEGTRMVFSTLISLKQQKKTIILIERKIEGILPFVDRIIALKEGKIVSDSSPRKFFQNVKLVNSLGIQPPQVVRLFYKLKERGFKLGRLPLTVEELVDGIHASCKS
ncbi:MAG: ATP-binding cassette domain-containing protein [Candidatus Aenigmatarchaeota archaeon]